MWTTEAVAANATATMKGKKKVAVPAVLIGAVSRGAECAKKAKPGIVERVKKFLPWIQQQISF